MDTLADLFVILLFLSAFFVVLSLVCELLERLSEWSAIRRRRGRASQSERLPQRSRVARPRRRPCPPATDTLRPSVAVQVARAAIRR